jgi:CBS domain-containing protein
MPVVTPRHVLSGILVREAMRRHILRLPSSATIGACIARLIKYKANALLVDDEHGVPAGVVSKTDLIGAFYVGLPIDTALLSVMNGPPLTCYPDDPLESALDRMAERQVHRLYVVGAESGAFTGVLSYTDVVALLYRYCRVCTRSTTGKLAPGEREAFRLLVRDVMTASVASVAESEPLARVVENISTSRFGALLITGEEGTPAGVVSKTDLIRAYRHATPLEAEARSVMTSPVVVWGESSPLYDALQYMFLKDVQRLFVQSEPSGRVSGVLSLSDAARTRSGTCKACRLSRSIDGV